MALRFFSKTLVLVLFVGLGGCVTTSGDYPLRYATMADSRLPDNFSQGQTFNFQRMNFDNLVVGAESEWAASIEEIRYHLANFDLIEINEIANADYVFGVFVGYLPDSFKDSIPLYQGGERQRVEVEREIPQYDSQGRYIGTRRVRETQYYTTPRVQTGTKDTVEETEQPVITLMMFAAEDFRSDSDYGTPHAEEFPYIFMSTSVSEIHPTTINQTAHCLVSGMLDSLPRGHERTTHNVPSHLQCAIFTDHTTLPPDAATPTG